MIDIVCANPFVKGVLIEQVQNSDAKAGVIRTQVAQITEIPNCSDGKALELSPNGKKGKRAPSKYQRFVGDCMRGGEKNLKQCAVEWNQQKS